MLAQKIEESFEILVINSSKDETSSIIRKHFPTVHFIQLKKIIFAATAKNTGIQKAKGDILAFIDADCTASSDWLNKMIFWHKNGYKAVAGSIVNESYQNIFSKTEYPLEILGSFPYNPKKEVRFVSAANSSFSRETFDKYGLFPQLRAGEDMVFCHKISEKGEKIILDPEIKVFHKNDINFKVYIRKQSMHGKYSFRARQMARLSGSFMNHFFIFPLLLPFLPDIRALAIIHHSLLLKNKLIYDILSFFPLFFLGCIMWSFGYTKGYFEMFLNKSDITNNS